jgi:PAS domain-containing protein
MNDQLLFSIGEVSSIVGLSRHTIRAWERRHQLVEPRRTASGQRRYTPDDVALLLQVKHAASRHGLSLKVASRSAQGGLSVPEVEARRPPVIGGGTAWEQAADRPVGWPVWRLAVDLMPHVMLLLDVEGTVRGANLAASEAVGVECDRMLGQRFTELIGAGAGDAGLEASLRRAYLQPRSLELELDGRRGARRWAFDCRPFSYQGRPWLAVFGQPCDDRLAGSASGEAATGSPPAGRPSRPGPAARAPRRAASRPGPA